MKTLQPLNKILILRRVLRVIIALVAALVCEHYYADTKQCWIVTATGLILLNSFDAEIKQVLQGFLLVVLSVFVAASLVEWIHQVSVLFVIAVVLVVVCRVLGQWLYSVLFLPVACVFMLMVTPMFGHADIYALLHDVVLGGIIAVLVCSVFFVGTVAVDFRRRTVVLLQGYAQYLSAIGELILQQPDGALHCEQQKIALEDLQQAEFPHWVYQRGFNPVFQQGHRHFLVRLEQVGEILFAMNYAARQPVTLDLLKEFKESIVLSVNAAEKIIAALIVRLGTENFDKPVSDLYDEIKQLEDNYRTFIDLPLELVDTSQDAMTLSVIIYGLKDLQKNLFKMAEALRK